MFAPAGRDAWRSAGKVVATQQERRLFADCHVPDARADHSCASHADCGVSGESCTVRQCSGYGYCFSPAGARREK